MPSRFYPLARPMLQFGMLLDVDPERVARRAGLPRGFLQDEGKGGTQEQVYATWEAMEAEAARPGLLLYLAKAFVSRPFTPAMFAFSCSPDLRTGFRRLADFKPLMAPMTMTVEEDGSGLHVSLVSIDTAVPAPFRMVWFEILCLVESARSYSGVEVVPCEIRIPEGTRIEDVDREFMQFEPVPGPLARISFSSEDAGLRLITENADVWPDFEKTLRRELAAREGDLSTAIRAKAALHDMLPGGEASIEALCRRLALSKRTLQRLLKQEGETFQSVLAATRAELARHYLAEDSLSIEEISYLLAYREPNSFYRAFQVWTGMTPAEARAGPM
ncbi:AraC family transcriptional regulator [Roseibium sp. RKSG952]|uniref:AraC family transcriptional regulator n=1 Tax=Roseibium sp. RKSG952 TaxID=2529384 RepID=UPI0012BBCBA1|nr:AraC family transcriptional regulator [Roseibium sp. RKSG952]MTH97991.1 AraC family transcriptional regulator [Roseibium sp. RKSG952]